MAAAWRWSAMAFLAVGREGLESVFFLIATVQQDVGIGVPIGAALGILCAFAFGVGMYRGGIKLNFRTVLPLDRRVHHFCRGRPGWPVPCTPSMKRAFGMCSSKPHSTSAAFCRSDSLVGTLLTGIFGYQDAPTVGEVIVLSGVPVAGPVASSTCRVACLPFRRTA